MPVTYAPQAPVAGAYSASYQLAAAAREREQAQLAAAANRGGGGGYGIDPAVIARMMEGDADRTQAAIANRDRQSFEVDKFQASQAPSQRDVYLQSMESEQQKQRFTQQAELMQTELSQQEKMRLARMKNAMGAIDEDSSLAPEEKANLKTMLQTGINPLELRNAKLRVEGQEAANRALADQRAADAASKQSEMEMNAQGFDKRTGYYVEPGIIDQITESILNHNPTLRALDPAIVQAMAKKEAARQGLGIPVYQESPNRWAPIQGGKGGKDSSKGHTGTTDHPTGISSEEEYLKVYDSARKEATEMQKQDQHSDKSVEWLEARTKQIFQEKLRVIKEYNDSIKPKGYQDPYAKKEVPKDRGTEIKEFNVQAGISKMQTNLQGIYQRTDLPPEVRKKATEEILIAQKILSENPDTSKMPPDQRQRVVDAIRYIDSIGGANAPTKAAASSAAGISGVKDSAMRERDKKDKK